MLSAVSQVLALALLAVSLNGPLPAVQDSSATKQSADSQAHPVTTDGKAKKVWTNENLSDATGPVSVVGDGKHSAKSKDNAPADANYVANTKKQLEKWNAQIADADKELVDLKNFNSGEPGTNPARQLHKSYNTEPVSQQMKKLEDKKKELQGKIDALLDEARKKGVLPGQLR